MLKNIYILSSLFVVLAISWAMLYQANFLYSFWHEYGGIGNTIEYFAPKNRVISSFELTDINERANVFSQISYAVHINSTTLYDIHFTTTSNITKRLLHQNEITHLLDVAHIINILYFIISIMFFVWCYTLYYHYKHALTLPQIRTQLINIFLGITVLIIGIIIIGPTTVFYYLHELLFPEKNQWFFYYEDSLMSTLMSAPDLFGWIALEWLLLYLFIFTFLQLTSSNALDYLLKITNKK